MHTSPLIHHSAQALPDVRKYALPSLHAYHQGAFFLRWLEDRKHVSREFVRESQQPRRDVESAQITYPEFFREYWDGKISAALIKESALPFVIAYANGPWVSDYAELLAPENGSILHAEYSEENYVRLAARFDERWQEFEQDASVFSPQPTAAKWVARAIVILLVLLLVFAVLTGIFSLFTKNWILAAAILTPLILLYLWVKSLEKARCQRLREISKRLGLRPD